MSNHNESEASKQHNEQLRTQSKYRRNLRQARENARDQVAIAFCFASDLLKGGAIFLNQSQNVVK